MNENNSFKSFYRELKRGWVSFRPIIRILFALVVTVSFITGFSIFKHPDWLKTDWVLLLIIPVGLATLSAFGVLFQIFERAIDSIRKAKKIRLAFQRVNDKAILVLKPKHNGIPETLVREETYSILKLLKTKKGVLFTGEAGVGKSGIACSLVSEIVKTNGFPLLIDARRLANIEHPHGLRAFFDLDESVIDSIEKISEDSSVLVIADQLDSTAGTKSCKVITDFLIDCMSLKNIYVVAVSRHKESNERGTLRPLLDAGFETFVCSSVSEELARQVLSKLGIQEIPASLLSITDNLLNLDIICEIIRKSTPVGIENIHNKVELWEKYIMTLKEREDYNGNGNELISEAVNLARIGLRSADRGFELDIPLTQTQSRLSSGNIILQVSGRRYQFRHDMLQDYLYAWYACERNFLLENVYKEIGDLHERNAIVWMRDIYQKNNTSLYERFLEDALDG